MEKNNKRAMIVLLLDFVLFVLDSLQREQYNGIQTTLDNWNTHGRRKVVPIIKSFQFNYENQNVYKT